MQLARMLFEEETFESDNFLETDDGMDMEFEAVLPSLSPLNLEEESDDSGISSEDNFSSSDEDVDSTKNYKKRSFTGQGSASKRRRVRETSDPSFHPATQKSITDALQMSDDENLIGDMSRSHTLPTIVGKHRDLKSISPETMSQVLNGEYCQSTDDVMIIDCRYPYEYEGGHIKGAVNIWSQQTMSQVFDELVSSAGFRHSTIIFHCEFSSERGPKMARFLRQLDRDYNKASYPQLCYPEIYLLEGGYKAFYHQHQSHCELPGYTPMDDPDFRSELKYFRSKSKAMKVQGSGRSRRRVQRRI